MPHPVARLFFAGRNDRKKGKGLVEGKEGPPVLEKKRRSWLRITPTSSARTTQERGVDPALLQKKRLLAVRPRGRVLPRLRESKDPHLARARGREEGEILAVALRGEHSLVLQRREKGGRSDASGPKKAILLDAGREGGEKKGERGWCSYGAGKKKTVSATVDGKNRLAVLGSAGTFQYGGKRGGEVGLRGNESLLFCGEKKTRSAKEALSCSAAGK